MSKELVISATQHETRVAIMEDGQLCEIYIEREKEFALVGSLYKGRVTRVLPGMQSAFVDIGLDSDAFLYVSDFLEHLEEYDHVAPPPENKTQKPFQPAAPGEVFGPSTTNGGVVQEPAAAEAGSAPAEAATSTAPAESVAAASGETTATAQSQPNVPAAAPVQQTSRPFEPRQARERGGFNDRGGRGGRNRRWGRHGGRDRRPGRDLPPSKYASPKPFDSRPREPRPYEPPPAGFEPIILPGESLAKYKDRMPTPAPTPPAGTVDHAAPEQAQPPVTTPDAAHDEPTASLPDSVYTPTYTTLPTVDPIAQESVTVHCEEASAAALAPATESRGEAPFAARAGETETEIPGASSERDEHMPELEQKFAQAAEVHAQNGASLSEDEATSLAEQLAEAKHEEAQAEADELPDAEESGAEPFVESAELEELQDALNDEHEDEAEEAEATADAMHEEALAAEAASEHAGEHADEHAEEHAEELAGEHAEGHADEHFESLEGEHETEGAHEAPQPQQFSDAQPTTARISEQPRARFQRPMRRGGRQQRGGGRRGGRPDNRPHQHPQHGHPRHEAHKRPQLISEMLKAGEEIIVQIAKEPLGKKGARITSHVALPGRYLVYMPTVDHIGVSRRIGSAEDRHRLRRLVTEAKGTFPGGFIVRTAAGGATDEEIRTDVEFLGRTWDTIRAASEQRRAPAILHRDLNLVQRILRDYLSDDYAAIWLDNEEEYSKVVEFVGRFQPKMVSRVKLYTKEAPIFEEFGIQQDLDKALRPKVWLKSGGHIVINHTEALVAIDVNTGKYVGRGSTRLEDTIVKTNLEAVTEIVRQIRLRDLGGIIVVDFIDMEERRNRDKVLAALDQALSQDRAPSKALSFNEFGLVCITRKRTKQALERVLCQPCPYCTGSGMVKSIPTICYEIQAEARKMAIDLDAPSLTLRVNPEIAKTLKTRESSVIEELEQSTRKSIIIQSDPTLHWEQYDIY
jgi:ribonuclease G